MNCQGNPQYKTTVPDEHWREEEFQWVRILSSAGVAKAMVLLYVQKACTAFHEFEPAWREGAVGPEHIGFYRRRLANRIRQVLVTMENNDLDAIAGAAELAEILHAVESSRSTDELAGLAERVHAVNHLLLDSLEAK